MFLASDWSDIKWPSSALDGARDTFEELLEHAQERDAIDTPLLPGRLVDPEAVARIPLLAATWETLEDALPSIHDIAEFMGTGTALDLLQLTESPSATLDVAITAPSWCRRSEHGLLEIVEPKRPNSVQEALDLAGERHVRTLCVPPRQADPTTPWPSAIAQRAGVALDGAITLDEAGNLIGVTRERVRQVCAALPLGHGNRRRWPLSPRLLQIAEILASATERPVADIDAELQNVDFEGSPVLDIERARSLLSWYGRTFDLEVDPSGLVLPSGSSIGLPEDLSVDDIRNMVWELSEGTGFLREPDLLRELDSVAPGLDPEVRSRAVDLAIWKDRLPLDYVFVARHKEPAVAGAMRRALSWVDNLPLAEVHESVVRRFRFRSMPAPPPPEVLGALIERLDGFELEDDKVRLAVPTEPDTSTILGWIGTQLLEAEDRVIHRSVLYQEARLCGMNTTSVGLYLMFGEITRSTGRGCVRLVGARPDAEAIERARSEALRLRVAEQRSFSYPESGIRMKVTVGNGFLDSGVISVPARAKRLIAKRSLAVSSELGSHGSVRLSGSQLYGFTSALLALDIMPGDEIVVDLDLRTNTASLEVDSDEDG